MTLIEELNKLQSRIDYIEHILYDELFDYKGRMDLIEIQHRAMCIYRSMLKMRIDDTEYNESSLEDKLPIEGTKTYQAGDNYKGFTDKNSDI